MGKIQASHWLCTNRNCDFLTVMTLPEEPPDAPICICGAIMRKTEPRPACAYLDFLRSDDELLQGTRCEKEF